MKKIFLELHVTSQKYNLRILKNCEFTNIKILSFISDLLHTPKLDDFFYISNFRKALHYKIIQLSLNCNLNYNFKNKKEDDNHA